jgi:tetratricopeptide (TPR) repeat protein
MALIAKKDDLEARKELLKAIKYKSDKVEVWKALAGIDERTRAKSLFLDLRRIVELDPNDLDARLKLARLMANGGAAEAALRILDAAQGGDKPNAEIHSIRAIALLRTNDSVGAIREAQRAFELDPTDGDAIALLAAKKSSDGDLDGALKLLDAIPANSKDDTRATFQRVEILLRKKEFAKAEELLRGLVGQNPQITVYQNQLIQVLIAQQKFADAEKEFRARIAANPSDPKLGVDFVRFLIATKGEAAGRAELEERLKAGGDDFDYRLAMAELDLTQNKADEVIQAFQKLLAATDKPDRAANIRLRLAQIYLAKGKTSEADALIAEVLSKDRKNVGALRLRAARQIDRGQFDGAVSDLREALNEQPKSFDLLMLMATAYERSGKGELADRQYADALKSSNFNQEIVLRYVAFLQRKSDLPRAEEVLTEAVGRNPTNIQLLASLAQAKLSRQDWSGAQSIADAIGRLNNGRVAADQIRAVALAGQNKIDESIAALEDAHKVAPNALQPALSLASAYVRQGKPDSAVALLKELSEKAPNNAQLLVFLGQAQLAQKKDQDAVQSFKKAIAQQPKELSGYAALSDFFIRGKDYESADKSLQAGLSELPGNINLRLSAASLQILKGNNDAAISQYEAILKDQPNSLVAINNLTSLLLDNRSDKQSIDRAIALSEKLKNSNLPQFQDTLGWAEYKQGDFKGAIATLENVVSKTPNLAAARYHLGVSYAAAGQNEKATEQFKAALLLEPDGSALKESIKAALK